MKKQTTPIEREVLATLALTLFSSTAALAFARVFEGWDFVVPMVVAIGAIHIFSFATRVAGVPPLADLVLLPLFGAWIVALIQVPQTLRFGLPTGATFEAFQLTFRSVADQFPTAIAPVDPQLGWLTVAVAAGALIAVCGDLFAFTARAVGESLSPGAVVFIFVAALGTTRLQVVLTGGLIATGIVAVAALAWHHDKTVRLRFTGRTLPMATPTVLGVAITVAVIGALIGPRLPGAGEQPVINPKAGGRSVTTIPSPLVDIRSRLTNQSDVEMFRVSATASSYWRVTTLPEFDGNTFRLPARKLESVSEPDSPSGGAFNVQNISIAALGGRTIPAAAEPTQADGLAAAGGEISLRINRDTSTLIAPDDVSTGDTFQVVSAPVSVTADELRAARTDTSSDDVYRSIPDEFPSSVATTAAEVTAGQSTDYDKLLALQSWFRDTFDYSTEVRPGHNTSAIEQFLNDRIGYCEQFSATFAAMARTLGMPSRVAVGFTPGDVDDSGSYVVRGKNAHAWPEVQFAGIGWVAFEPTPGRGIPGAEDYTGVAPQQDESSPATVPGTTAPTSGTNPANPRPNPEITQPPTPGSTPAAAAATSGRSSRALWWLLAGIIIVVGAALIPWASRRYQRSREHHLPAPDRAVAAWKRSQRAVERTGVQLTRASTVSDWVQATASVAPRAVDPMRSIGDAFEVASFADPNADFPFSNEELSEWADEVEADTARLADRTGRVVAAFRMR